ncbi:Radical SAM superfamily protein [Oceanospirillum multiglobuliferum]|uniref:Radical SAM protein n=3 Tax=Oceanospirillum TaxID=965 RepID=A0A1T4R554_9GAMM|nr:radical SAM protein [Oceanospirillum multiglobuliferum]OPX55234.1 radical SAM protein [Oceanospirillum multiglobuliferum]SKA10966.1 Radical SAM superfamily protein [Oceanospirillum multiglobuliferum]
MFDDFPIQYIDPVYRPPSEARSLILPVTNGCSWNQCTFCEMYTDPQKKFYARKEQDVLNDINQARQQLVGVHKVFLADGDAMVLSTRRLSAILDALNEAFPELTRVGAYCLPRNIANKTVEELVELKNKGLSILYVGIESGDDEVLKRIQKGETAESTYNAVTKIKKAGIKTSVMVLNGLGGTRLSEQHALNSAKLINRIQPDYLSTLVLTFHKGDRKYKEAFGTDFEMFDTASLLAEMYCFINALELDSTIFRSDHVSNRLVLKGVLGRDKNSLLSQIEDARQHGRYRNISTTQI